MKTLCYATVNLELQLAKKVAVDTLVQDKIELHPTYPRDNEGQYILSKT